MMFIPTVKKSLVRARVKFTNPQSGSSLLEVLVAILLVSVGLLGVAGLSGATFSYNKVSQLRLTGLALVNDYADRARVNVYGYDRGNYDIAKADDFASTAVTVPDSNLDLDPSDSANAATAADALASADIDQFLRSVRNRLPQGDAVVISTPTAAARNLDVWLIWKESQTATADVDDDKGDFSLFDASKENCPNNLSTSEKLEYSCMYFKVGL
ncbi:MAG: type IV pilus modification protein PilV [Hydrogenophaga sp.]|uniref:type IV pilus modification protein PilV n=1 Tax=Hydrogenophaga sp. TaxID=1904254 RepID=UPI0025BD7E66|nr:type IV pilus modification protein PilV [Hydrogenophaga sp.]MBT9550001.1 type IV pilus modification protein PilV [Hydrogenophaga sp.]